MSYIYGLLKGAISALLHLMHGLTGNFGVAIIKNNCYKDNFITTYFKTR